MFQLCPTYSSNHKFSKKPKISPDTNLQKTYKNIKHNIFPELVPLVSPLLEKHMRLGHAGIMDHSVSLSKDEGPVGKFNKCCWILAQVHFSQTLLQRLDACSEKCQGYVRRLLISAMQYKHMYLME